MQRKKFHEVLNTVNIDGYIVGEDNTFSPTKDYIYNKFLEFNKKYFDNKLSLNSELFKVFPYKHVLGQVETKFYVNRNTAKVVHFGISNYYSRSEKTCCNTILHEMIHVYQYQVLLPQRLFVVGENLAHGYTFIEKMKEINSHGWEVHTGETMVEYENRGEVNPAIIAREENKKNKIEEISDFSKYYLYIFVPEDILLVNTLDKGQLSFVIIDKTEAEDLDFYLDHAFCHKNYFRKYPKIIYKYNMEESSFTELLKKSDYYSARYRIIFKNLIKSKDFLTYIFKRSFSFPYEKFKKLENEGMIKNIEGKRLPELNTEMKESQQSGITQVKKRLERDPYVTVLNSDEEDVITIAVC